MKIAVVTDSGCGISKKAMQLNHFFYLPLHVLCDEKEYLDGVELSIDQFYDMLKDKRNVKTSMPPVGIMMETLEEIKAQGYEEIIFIPLTPGISSTASVFMSTAEEFGLTCHLIDCYTTLGTQAYLTQCAVQLVEQGKSSAEIVALLKDSIKESDTMIIPDDLSQLKAGGRLTPMAAALAGLLKIKPILQLNASTEGKIDVYDKVRTMSKSISKVLNLYAERNLNENHLLMLLDSNADCLEDVHAKIKEMFPNVDVRIIKIPPVIAAHTGLGCIAPQYIRKVPRCKA